jgi:hypothetical protein
VPRKASSSSQIPAPSGNVTSSSTLEAFSSSLNLSIILPISSSAPIGLMSKPFCESFYCNAAISENFSETSLDVTSTNLCIEA